MAKPIRDLTNTEFATLFEMFDYFCSRMNLGKSSLDNVGIRCMNKLFLELRKQEEVIKF